MRRGEPHAALRILHGEADRASAAGDHASAATLLLESSIGYTMTGDPEGMFATLERARAAAAQVPGPAALIARIMLAVAGMVVGRARDGVARELEQIEPLIGALDPIGLGEPLGLYAQASLWRDLDRAERTLDWLIGRFREASAFGALPFPLTVRAMVNERRGRWAEAEADAEEAVRLAREIDQATIAGFCLSTLANVEAGLGRVDDAARTRARDWSWSAPRAPATSRSTSTPRSAAPSWPPIAPRRRSRRSTSPPTTRSRSAGASRTSSSSPATASRRWCGSAATTTPALRWRRSPTTSS